MTGQEILDDAIAQADTHTATISSAVDAFATWSLRRVNFAVQDLYYFLRSRLMDGRFFLITEYDFQPRNEADYPQGATDVLLFQPEQEIEYVFVKLSRDGRHQRADKYMLGNLPYPPETLSQSNLNPIQRPVYTLTDKKLQIFPKPTEMIPGGIILYQNRPAVNLVALSDAVVSIPPDYQRILVHHVTADILQKLRRYDDATAELARYDSMKEQITKELARRGGAHSFVPETYPVYP